MITRNNIRELIHAEGDPAVSLYLPTHRTHPGTEQDRIRYKDLLKAVENSLQQLYDDRDISDILERLRSLSTQEFWNHQKDGLAVFANHDLLRFYKLPAEVEELQVVSDNFHTKPLMKLLQHNQRYLLLAISENDVRLFEGDREGLVEQVDGDLPEDVEDALGEWEWQRFRWDSFGPQGNATGTMTQSGSDYSQLEEKRKKEYLQAIDRELANRLYEEKLPLVLACVQEYWGLYRDISDYPHLVQKPVEGSPDRLDEEELHEKAWPLIEPVFESRENQLIEAFNNRRGTGLTASELEEVAQTSVYGQVDTLLLRDGAHVWGTLDRDTGEIYRGDDAPNPVDSDLLDEIAEVVTDRGGEVWILEDDKFPLEDHDQAAILRY